MAGRQTLHHDNSSIIIIIIIIISYDNNDNKNTKKERKEGLHTNSFVNTPRVIHKTASATSTVLSSNHQILG